MARNPISAPTKKPVVLKPVRPNLGIQLAYQKSLDALIASMQADVSRTILRLYRQAPPEMAADESPAAQFRDAMNKMSRDWTRKFDRFANQDGKQFGQRSTAFADRAFMANLRSAGFTVKFKMTAQVNDIVQATIAEQVGLIRSIPEQYLTSVQGAVMRSVQTGRDMHSLATELTNTYGVTKRRAAFIARDQNNKATATITRARQEELGITQAIWLHSLGGKQPRPEHVAMNGKPYEISKGAFLEGKWTWPGVEINCRCVSKSIIPGLD